MVFRPPLSPSVPALFTYYALHLDIRLSAFRPDAKRKDQYHYHSDVRRPSLAKLSFWMN